MQGKLLIFIFFVLIGYACSSNNDKNHKSQTTERKVAPESPPDNQKKVHHYKVRIINKIPHDENAYTQGLTWHDGYLYESTGQRGESSLRKIDTKTGEIIKKIDIPSRYFSEGICIHENKIFMITWTSGKCFVYDINSFNKISEMNYKGQGWGLTNYSDKFLMSDGSNILRLINPDGFNIEKNFSIVDENFNPVSYLNEMENIKGEIWANIWMQDRIAIINPESGILSAWVDISNIRDFVRSPRQEVSNGIAYNIEEDIVYLTGKYWDCIFLVQLIDN